MRIERIDDDKTALAIAVEWGIADEMLAAVATRMPESKAAGIGVSITAKRGEMNADGTFVFVLVSYFENFVEGENGWMAVRWSEATWEDLPVIAGHMSKAEELLPGAINTEKAKEKLDKYRREKQ